MRGAQQHTVASCGISKRYEASTNDKGHKVVCFINPFLPFRHWIPDEPASQTCSYSLPPAPWLETPVRAALHGAFSVPGDATLQRALF